MHIQAKNIIMKINVQLDHSYVGENLNTGQIQEVIQKFKFNSVVRI